MTGEPQGAAKLALEMMPYLTLKIFRRGAQVGVEGFRDVEQLGAWAADVLIPGHSPYAGWDAVLPDTHNDYREVLSVIDTLDSMARFLVALDYPRPDVTNVLRQQFPATDEDAVEAAYDEAVIHRNRCEAQLDAAIRREGDAAQAAEHDLDKTMHIDHGSST